MDNEKPVANNCSLGKGGVTVHPDLRLVAFKGERGIEVHLTPGDAIDIAFLLFKFAYEIPGKHQDDLRSLAGTGQPKG